MKKAREAFEKEYARVSYTDGATGKTRVRYEYRGEWYGCGNEPRELRRLKIFSAALAAVNTAAVLAAGSVSADVNRIALTSIPYGLSLAALIFVLLGTGLFIFSGSRVKEQDLERARKIISAAAPAEAALLAFAFAAGMVWAAVHGSLKENILPLLGCLAGACCSVLFRLLYGRIRYEKIR